MYFTLNYKYIQPNKNYDGVNLLSLSNQLFYMTFLPLTLSAVISHSEEEKKIPLPILAVISGLND